MSDTEQNPSIDEILSKRHNTHGPFERNAEISQNLKQHIRQFMCGDLSNVHREVIDMICLKLSRILSGQHTFQDHWDDIAGYATLGSHYCVKYVDDPAHIAQELDKAMARE